MNQFPYWNLFYIKSTMICILFTAAVQTQPSIQGVNTMNFTITSPAFHQDRRIPDHFTCEGENISPRLEWSGVPDSTSSFALSCLDPDAPPGTWVHWVLYDLAAGARSLDEGVPKSEKLENNTLQGACWGGGFLRPGGLLRPLPAAGSRESPLLFPALCPGSGNPVSAA